jgi:nucleotidyltransferase substrate binding protein (TIGR01987 family)
MRIFRKISPWPKNGTSCKIFPGEKSFSSLRWDCRVRRLGQEFIDCAMKFACCFPVEAEKIDCAKLKDALVALESNLGVLTRDAVGKDEALKRAVFCGIVQTFEVAYEVSVSFITRKMKMLHGGERIGHQTRVEFFNLAAELGIIQDAQRWHRFHAYRNNSSHNYDGSLQADALNVATAFLCEGKNLLENLSRD